MKKYLVLLLLIIVLVGAGAFVLVRGSSQQTVKTDNDSVEAELADKKFLEEMALHHHAAVDIAAIADEQAESAEIKTLAAIIVARQNQEIDQMKKWYQQWYGSDLKPAATDPHAAEPTGNVPKNFDEGFMVQMILHNEAGVKLAKAVLESTSRQELKDFANSIISVLSTQTEQMKGYQKNGFAPPDGSHCDSVSC